jgi:hypothetical protein
MKLTGRVLKIPSTAKRNVPAILFTATPVTPAIGTEIRLPQLVANESSAASCGDLWRMVEDLDKAVG